MTLGPCLCNFRQKRHFNHTHMRNPNVSFQEHSKLSFKAISLLSQDVPCWVEHICEWAHHFTHYQRYNFKQSPCGCITRNCFCEKLNFSRTRCHSKRAAAVCISFNLLTPPWCNLLSLMVMFVCMRVWSELLSTFGGRGERNKSRRR